MGIVERIVCPGVLPGNRFLSRVTSPSKLAGNLIQLVVPKVLRKLCVYFKAAIMRINLHTSLRKKTQQPCTMNMT